MHKVIKFFHDLTDNNHPYNVGDIYPREGVEVSEARIAELAGNYNKRGVPLIQIAEDAPKKATAKRAKKAAAK